MTVLLALALTLALVPDRIMTYGGGDDVSDADADLVRVSLVDGWREFAKLVPGVGEAPKFVRSNFGEARVAIRKGTAVTILAGVSWFPGHDQPYIYVWVDKLRDYTPVQRGRVMAHELSHFYFVLVDHYKDAANRRPHCIMDNFHQYGWSGKYCGDCQATVNLKMGSRREISSR